jgi:ribosomal protein L7Ae-like RNA K-turn-binding protein
MNKSITPPLDTQQLKALCAVLVDVGKVLTKSELTNILNQSHISSVVSHVNVLMNDIKCRGNKRRAEWQ